MEGKRNRGEVTAELSEKVWARLCRENALVASEVWVDDASRVDFVAYRPHRPRDRSSNHATAAELESGTFTFVEVKSCMDDFTSGHGISIDRVTIEEGTGPDGKPFRYIRVAYTFENVTDSDAVAPYTDINAYQDGIKLDRSYKVQDQRAQKQIEPGGKLKSFTAFAPDSETVPVTVKVMAPGEKEPRSERCYCIVNPGLQ